MRFQLKNYNNFRLAWNCALRAWNTEDDLKTLNIIYDKYGAIFDSRTIWCGLEDCARSLEYKFDPLTDVSKMSAKEIGMVNSLMKKLWVRYLTRYLTMDSNGIPVMEHPSDMLNKLFDSGSMQPMRKEFEKLKAEKNVLKVPTAVYIKKEDYPIFNRLAVLMVKYSWGRHTYMPTACDQFITEIMPILSEETLRVIATYIDKSNESSQRAIPVYAVSSDYLYELSDKIHKKLPLMSH